MAPPLVAQLPHDARRIVVRGTTGSGKSTLARRIAAATGFAHVELDALYHQPGWTPLDPASFRAKVASIVAEDAWVLCGNYRQVADQVLDRADTVVLFDLPRRIVMTRVVRRTLRRVGRREVLWNGNRERWQNLVSVDPTTSVIAWAWTTHGDRHREIAAFLCTPPRDDLCLVHLATQADERRFAMGLGERAGAPTGSA